MRQHIHICRKPRHVVEGSGIQPAGVGVLAQLEFASGNPAHVTLHAQMKSRVVPLNRVQQFTHCHLQIEFLGNFAHHCSLRSLAGLNLAAGKLPAAAVLMVGTLHCQHTISAIQNNGRHHLHDSQVLHHAQDCSTLRVIWQTHTDTAGRFYGLQRRGKSVE